MFLRVCVRSPLKAELFLKVQDRSVTLATITLRPLLAGHVMLGVDETGRLLLLLEEEFLQAVRKIGSVCVCVCVCVRRSDEK